MVILRWNIALNSTAWHGTGVVGIALYRMYEWMEEFTTVLLRVLILIKAVIVLFFCFHVYPRLIYSFIFPA